MDPQATWNCLQEMVHNADWEEAREMARSMLDWLKRGGFPPSIDVTDGVNAESTREYVTEFCRRVLDGRVPYDRAYTNAEPDLPERP